MTLGMTLRHLMFANLKGEKIMAKQVETQDLMNVETVHILNNEF